MASSIPLVSLLVVRHPLGRHWRWFLGSWAFFFFQITICGYHDLTNILAQESRLKQGSNDETWSTYLLLVSKTLTKEPLFAIFSGWACHPCSGATIFRSCFIPQRSSTSKGGSQDCLLDQWKVLLFSIMPRIWHTYYIDICLKMGGQCSWVRMDLIRFLNLGWKRVPRFPSCTPQQSRPCTRHGKKVPGWHPQLKLASSPASSKLRIDFLMFSDPPATKKQKKHPPLLGLFANDHRHLMISYIMDIMMHVSYILLTLVACCRSCLKLIWFKKLLSAQFLPHTLPELVICSR